MAGTIYNIKKQIYQIPLRNFSRCILDNTISSFRAKTLEQDDKNELNDKRDKNELLPFHSTLILLS